MDMTKVSYDGASTSFTAGDKIAVYTWTGSADAVPATRTVNGIRNTLGNDGKWAPETQMLWKNASDPHFFLGVYPAKDITDFTADTFTLDPGDYTAGDLLIATNFGSGNAGLKTSDGAVKLDFDPYFSAYEFNLWSKDDQELTITSLTLSATEGFISGHYYWDLTAGAGHPELGTPNTDADRTVTVSGSWTISQTTAANITLFALPNNLSGLTFTIKFTMAGGAKGTAILDLTDSDIVFGARQKTRIKGLYLNGNWRIFIAAVDVDEWTELDVVTINI